MNFTCGYCGGFFTSGRTPEESAAVLAEDMARLEETDPSEMVHVCEDCWRKMEAAYPPEQFVEDRAAGIERKIDLSKDVPGSRYDRN